MEENNLIDMELEDVKHCVSTVSLRVAYVGMKKVIDSWNTHTIPGWFRDSMTKLHSVGN